MTLLTITPAIRSLLYSEARKRQTTAPDLVAFLIELASYKLAGPKSKATGKKVQAFVEETLELLKHQNNRTTLFFTLQDKTTERLESYSKRYHCTAERALYDHLCYSIRNLDRIYKG